MSAMYICVTCDHYVPTWTSACPHCLGEDVRLESSQDEADEYTLEIDANKGDDSHDY